MAQKGERVVNELRGKVKKAEFVASSHSECKLGKFRENSAGVGRERERQRVCVEFREQRSVNEHNSRCVDCEKELKGNEWKTGNRNQRE